MTDKATRAIVQPTMRNSTPRNIADFPNANESDPDTPKPPEPEKPDAIPVEPPPPPPPIQPPPVDPTETES